MFRPRTLIRLCLAAVAVLCSVALLQPTKSEALQAAKKKKKQGKGYALLIGVRDYEHGDLPALKYSESDAEALAKLLDRAGSPFHKRVRVLSCTRGQKDRADRPTAENIRKALKTLAQEPTRDDTVLIAFSGHGGELLVEDPAGKKPSRTYPYVFPVDARLSGIDYETGKHAKLVLMQELMDALSDSGAGAKLVLVDACRNEMKARSVKRSLAVSEAKLPARTGVLFSTDSGEVAWESEKLGHGVFFHFVIEGLEGKAKDEEGTVSWDSLSAYVKKQVVRQSPEYIGGGGKQTPHEMRNLKGESPVLLLGAGEGVVKKPEEGKGWEVTLAKGVTMRFVRIPKGKFKMGSPRDEKERGDDEQQHEVEITEDFYMGVTEVTQAQFEDVMGYNPSFNSRDGEGKERVDYGFMKPAGGKDKVPAKTRTFPVDNVSWEEAREFCKKLSALPSEKKEGRQYRLPTEAEWEYACRGGGSSSYQPFHVGPSFSSRDANFQGELPYGGAAKGTYLERTCEVRSYRPNAFGLYDMHGNVEEWCSDWYDKNYYASSPKRDPQGPTKGYARVLRGGAWHCGSSLCRSARRGFNDRDPRDYGTGFRVAVSLSE